VLLSEEGGKEVRVNCSARPQHFAESTESCIEILLDAARLSNDIQAPAGCGD